MNLTELHYFPYVKMLCSGIYSAPTQNLGATPQLECWPALVQFVVDLTYVIAL